MTSDTPWLDRPEIVNVSDWLTYDQFTWLMDGVLIKRGPADLSALLKTLFIEDMVETDVDDGSLWTCYVYQVPDDVEDLPEFKYLRGHHRGSTGYTLTVSKILPGDIIVCHRRSSYNPGPVRAYEKIFTRKHQQLTARNTPSARG